MADLISEYSASSSVAANGTVSLDVDCGQPFAQPRNVATDSRVLTVTLAVLALSGGVSPSVALVVSRKEEDNVSYPNGTLTQVDAPAALTSVTAVTRNIGPNQTQAANLSRFARVSVTVAGGPTTCQWAVTAIASR